MDLKVKHNNLVAEARALVAAAKSAENGPSEEQLSAIEAKNAEITEVKAAIARAEKAASFEAEFAAVDADVVDESSAPAKGSKAAKSLGEHFVKSAPNYKSAKSDNHVAFGAPEFKAATTTGGRQYIDQDTQVVGIDRRPLTIRDILTPGTLSGNTLAYTVLTLTAGAAAAVAEGTQKPKIEYDAEPVREGLSKIAALTDVTDEMIEDEDYVVSAINNELITDLQIVEEDQLLNGSGVGANVKGILNRSGLQTEVSASAADNADAAYRAKRKVHTATNRRADAIVINPVDYERERLRKDANGQYLGGGMFTGSYGTAFVDEPNMWGLTTIQTTAIAEGTALVGNFASATLLQKGGLKVDRSSENKDNYETNTVTFRVEERIGLKVPKPHAFVKLTLSNA